MKPILHKKKVIFIQLLQSPIPPHCCCSFTKWSDSRGVNNHEKGMKMHFLWPLTMRLNVFWVSKNQTAMLKWGNEDIENKWRRCCVSLLLLHHEWRLRWNDCSTTVGGTMTATEWGHVYTVWNISYISPEKQVPLQIGDAPKYQSCSFFLNCSNWGGQRTDWHGLVLATLLRRKRSWEDMEGGWALHHMEYVRTFGTFFRMASFITSAIVLNHHGCVTVKANFAGDASRISVGNMRRISLGNMRRISVQNMRGNSIIPDMSFRPHLLNDLRSLENNRGMSKVVNMFFFFH